jgi:hypothetical protein
MTALETPRTAAPAVAVRVDPRGQRFAASLTVAVLAAVLLLAPSGVATALVAAQAVVFAAGVGLGPHRSPYAWLFRTAVRPRLGPPAETEDARPPRFAQGVGLAFALVAVAGLAAGLTTLGLVATAFALVAALLNAAFGFCLGCEMYLLLRRVTDRSTRTTAASPAR